MTFRRVPLPTPALAACALALLCILPACSPVVTHGPRVDPGFSFNVTAGGAQRLCDSTVCSTELVPQMGAGLRYGRAADETKPGFSVGVTASASIISSDMDLYAQLPRGMSNLDVGAGVLLGGAYSMPYLQAGRLAEDGSGFYTTQGLALFYPRPVTLQFMGPTDGKGDARPVYWAPTVAYQRRAGRRTLHVYLSGAFGATRYTQYIYTGSTPGTIETRRTERVSAVMLGFTAEQAIGRPRYTVAPTLPPTTEPRPPGAPPGHPLP